jgi:hypothetical protein
MRELHLDGTRAADLAPLASLVYLQVLLLGDTRVADVSPLAGMSYLWLLTLGNTAVSDLGPLHALTGLEIHSTPRRWQPLVVSARSGGTSRGMEVRAAAPAPSDPSAVHRPSPNAGRDGAATALLRRRHLC